MPDQPKNCPSRSCQEGTHLLGVMTQSGSLAYLRGLQPVDVDFVTKAGRQGRPESRFRFSGPCLEDACPQWTGTSCHIANVVVNKTVSSSTRHRLPACGIRSSCRWYFQRGADACAVCPTVVADTGGIATYRSENQIAASSEGYPSSVEG